ncbi:MAG: ADP-forming succinate--CoA ligase subunit beta [Chlamydiales bacterium]|nr:ADP-forming succinate--CoA ligase subunit beta [Chlamydiales bacterium]
MNTHEYQAKAILKKYGIPVSEGIVISSRQEAPAALERLGTDDIIIKVQVHAGGRGKAGGVKFAKSRDEALKLIDQMLGMKLVTNQTGKDGIIASQLLLCSPIKFEKEYYVGAIIDRQKRQAVLIVSPDGGVDIEEIAAKTPERIMTLPIRFDGLLRNYQKVAVAKFMGWKGDIAKQGMDIVAGLAKAFIECDASLLELNPLVLTSEGQLLALDAKLSVDENALFRHPEIAKLYDPSQLPAAEVRATEFDLAYVALDGNIGCMVNGAGLAMATMDIINHHGGKPANFLDVGGSATEEKVAEGFKIILSDPQVKAILVNIFGGIMNCVTLAGGIIVAIGDLELSVPLVVRMEGTNVVNGKKMLADSGLNIIIADSLKEAAEKAVAAAQ